MIIPNEIADVLERLARSSGYIIGHYTIKLTQNGVFTETQTELETTTVSGTRDHPSEDTC